MIKSKKASYFLIAFASPIILFAMLYYLKGIYPFGSTSNYIWDLDIQYHDFFCYLKDILSGEAGVEYTFSQSLGGSPIALIGYYLMSPINLLIVFFEKSQLQLFVYIATSLKLGLCGLFSYTFMHKRFSFPRKFCLLLSLAFSFTQYVIGQASNIMWLDGVYMLPLIMLGIHLYVKDGKPSLFYLSNALSIVFCWYIGYMNCIFAVLYYVFETILLTDRFHFKEQVIKLFKFLSLEFLSLLLSFVVFLPVMLKQSAGRGMMDQGIFNFGTNGKFLDILKGFEIGSVFPGRQITLFCTVAVLLFFFAFWFSKSIAKKQKVAAIFLLGFMVASMFFTPLEHIWCGFKYEGSYMYRFGYLAIMAVILIAAMQIEKLYNSGTLKLSDQSVAKGGAAFILILLAADWVRGLDTKRLWLEILLILFYIGLLYLIANRPKWNLAGARRLIKPALHLCFAATFFAEILFNAKVVMGTTYTASAQRTVQYTLEQKALIDSIKISDHDFYRIEQTSSRNYKNVCGFYANESLAYGYSGLQSYTSCYDDRVADILIDAGYNTSLFPSFYYDPILPMDSLLGVKYLLSQKEYLGYQKTDLPSANKKAVYYNPYALPLGFETAATIFETIEHTFSFEYINKLYSAIMGYPVEVFRQVDDVAFTQGENQIVYDLSNCSKPAAGSILYVSFENKDIRSDALCVNGTQVSTYNRSVWGSWNNISYLGDMEQIYEVSLTGCNLSADKTNPKFYYVDMASFTEVVSKLQNNSVGSVEVSDGHVKAQYHAEQDGQIMFTVPYDEGWHIEVNSKKVELQSANNQFIVVPVTAGSNQIEMHYSIKGKGIGILSSIVSIVLFILFFILKKRPAFKYRLKRNA